MYFLHCTDTLEKTSTKSFTTTALFFPCTSQTYFVILNIPSTPTTNASVTISTYYPLTLLLCGDLFASVPIFVGSVFSSPCPNVTPSSKTMQAVGERENERVNVGETGDVEVGRGVTRKMSEKVWEN